MNQIKIDTTRTPAEKYEEAALELALYNLLMKERDKALQPLDEASELLLEEQYNNSLLQRLSLIKRKTHRFHSGIQHRRNFAYFFKIAALIVLYFNLSLTVAVASSSTFRSYLSQFFIQTNNKSSEIGFLIADTTINIPDNWSANIFPTYIPEGYNLVESVSNLAINSTLYINEEGKVLSIEINEKNTRVDLDTENAIISSAQIHGTDATIFGKEGKNTIVWPYGDQFIIIYMDDSLNEAIKVAESIHLINK